MKTDNKPTSKPENNRRKFLVGATLGSVGAVVVATTGKDTKELLAVAASVAPVVEGKPKGYHVTDHILQYYETTRI